MLLRFAYLAVTHAFAALRLLPMTDRQKDIEILALRHQIAVVQRQLGDQHPRLRPEDRAFLAALLVPLPRGTLRQLRFDVPRGSVHPAGKPGWAQIPGPDSLAARLAARRGLPRPQFPPAVNIRWMMEK